MKKFFYILTVMFLLNVTAQAQTSDTKFGGITARIEHNNLLINWSGNLNEANYFEVQGSTDGKSFSTIGMVFGQDPSGNKNDFKFKQSVDKIKPGLKYYRVLHIETPETAIASNTIKVSK